VPQPAGSLHGLPLRFVAPQMSVSFPDSSAVFDVDVRELCALIAGVIRITSSHEVNVRFDTPRAARDSVNFARLKIPCTSSGLKTCTSQLNTIRGSGHVVRSDRLSTPSQRDY